MISSVPEQALRDRQRADRVVGHDATGVADHVRVALAQSERAVDVEASVHARHDGRFGGRRQREVALVERGHVVGVVREQVVGRAHVSPRGVGAGGKGPVKLSKADRVLGIFTTSPARPAPAPPARATRRLAPASRTATWRVRTARARRTRPSPRPPGPHPGPPPATGRTPATARPAYFAAGCTTRQSPTSPRPRVSRSPRR